MDNNYADMYNTNDNDDANSDIVAPVTTQSVSLVDRGMIKEIEINGKKLAVIDPAMVHQLERVIATMNAHIAKIDTELRSLNNKLANQERRMQTLSIALDNKVSYE